MHPLASKLFFAATIFVAGWLGGRVALSRQLRGSRFMSWGNAFAAGVFLGTGLIHLLSEADAAWRELGWSYPMALVLAALGFMATLLFEHVLIPAEAHAVVHAHTGEELGHETIDRLTGRGTPYALLVALSVHSVLAGIALGGQESLIAASHTFLAIIAHKSSAAFALGSTLARSEIAPDRSHRLILLFAVATPAGILLGAVAGGLLRNAAGLYFDATFLALAAGTFIYIASIDILQDEFLHAGGRLAKWLFAAGAIALVALLALWI